MVLKVQKFEGPVSGRFPQCGTPDFWRNLVPDIYNRSKFEDCAVSGLEVDTLVRKRKIMANLG